MKKITQVLFFKLSSNYTLMLMYFRIVYLKMRGMHIGKNAKLLGKIHYVWPNRIKLGNNCKIEPDVYFKYSGFWEDKVSINIGAHVFVGTGCEFNISDYISIGNDSLIASGCRFIDHDHGIQLNEELIRLQEPSHAPIILKDNVWLGCNVVVLKGVTIESGAVVGSGAVVTKSIPANEIWGGIPAKKIGIRH